MFKRILPAPGLLVLAPLVGEYLLGNIAINALPMIIRLIPLYGGGALLIREVARRWRLGWPGIILLGLAYAVIEGGPWHRFALGAAGLATYTWHGFSLISGTSSTPDSVPNL
ncbi:hypothetical protein ABZ297_28410 [Nonomuraea sp. NPDC005983]|uniref:hypothetical protein n=1 Tax=Nonomuraea sp. NPDC005983 TaxID=3155595 RepID=UPI0033B5F191